MRSLQQNMKDLLDSIDLPKREIRCYGNQITVECISQKTCEKWAKIIKQFATVKTIIESLVETKESLEKYTTKNYMSVYKLYATVNKNL